MAEGVGFEPTVPCGTAVFKTAAIVHSATLPPDVGDSRSPEKFYLDGAFWTLPALRALAETQMRFTCPVSRTTRTR